MTEPRELVPRRALGALATTVFALVLLFSFKTPEVATPSAATGGGDQVIAAPPQPSTAAGGATAPPSSTAEPGTTAPGAAYADGTVMGPTVSTRYGNVQVQVTISGGAITDVEALQLPSRDGHSARISQIAEPILRDEALAAQSANIDLLSGATFTSSAYDQSLQAALDQASA